MNGCQRRQDGSGASSDQSVRRVVLLAPLRGVPAPRDAGRTPTALTAAPSRPARLGATGHGPCGPVLRRCLGQGRALVSPQGTLAAHQATEGRHGRRSPWGRTVGGTAPCAGACPPIVRDHRHLPGKGRAAMRTPVRPRCTTAARRHGRNARHRQPPPGSAPAGRRPLARSLRVWTPVSRNITPKKAVTTAVNWAMSRCSRTKPPISNMLPPKA